MIFGLFLILQSGIWGTIPPMPIALQEVGVAAFEGRVYVVGGLDETGAGRNTLEIFNTRTGRWETGPPLPASIHHPNVAAVGSKLYVAGGYTGSTFQAVGTTFELDTDRMTWTRKADMPTARGAGAAVGYNGRLYVFGGDRGLSVSDAEVFDPATNSWSTLAPMPTPRNHIGAAEVRGKIYVIGGRAGNLNVNEAYDPLTNTWTTKTSMPTARSGHAVAALNNFIFAFGGEGNPNSPTGTFPETEAYDPELDAWTSLQPMPTPRHGIGAGVVGNRILIPGGGIVAGFGATSISDFFDVRQELLIPQFVVGAGYSSSITVTNPEQSRTAEVTVSLTDINGAPLETNLNGTSLSMIRFSVPPLASRTVLASEPALTSLNTGTASITSDARITAYALIRGVGPQLTVYPAAPARNVIFDVRRMPGTGISTGVAVSNVSSQAASVTIRLHNATGEEASQVGLALASGEHLSRFLHQLFPDLENADFTGTVSIRSTQQLAVAALGFDPSGVVTIPVVPIE
jgi:Kelch motif